MALVILIGAAR